jgi:cytochrome c oxidase cbb3-type subunit I
VSVFNPYLLMSLFYFSIAIVATLGSALVSADLLASVGSLRWLRVHFITLGMLTQAVLGILPALVAARAGQRTPRTRWDIWLVFNAGLLGLLVGIPLINEPMMIAGGTLVMIAVALLAWELRGLKAAAGSGPGQSPGGSPGWFYRVALGYLLLGSFVGTGLWLGWSNWLHLPAPKEVHVHSNLWGFAALLLAGFLLELVPDRDLRQPGWQRSVKAIFWLMVLGALGLAAGPWIENTTIETVGLVAHTVATLWLLVRWARTQRQRASCALPGALHLVTSYFWLLVAVAMAPLIVFTPARDIAQRIAQQGGPILIYGWLLHFSYGLIPYLFRRSLLPGRPPRLGGNWLSLVAGHLGTGLYIVGLFAVELRPVLHAAGYALWALSALPIVIDLWQVLRAAQDEVGQRLGEQLGSVP